MVECDLAKVDVVGSKPIRRSNLNARIAQLAEQDTLNGNGAVLVTH